MNYVRHEYRMRVAWLCQSSDGTFSSGFCSIKSWVDKMQEDLVTLAKTASGVNQLVDVSTTARHL